MKTEEENWKAKFLSASISGILDGMEKYIERGFRPRELKFDLSPYFWEIYALMKQDFTRTQLDEYFERKLNPSSLHYHETKILLNIILDGGEEEYVRDRLRVDPEEFLGKLLVELGEDRESINNAPMEIRGGIIKSYDRYKEKEIARIGYKAYMESGLGFFPDTDRILKSSFDYVKRQRENARESLEKIRQLEIDSRNPKTKIAFQYLKELARTSY